MYQQAQPTTEPIPRPSRSSFDQAAPSDSSDTVPISASAAAAAGAPGQERAPASATPVPEISHSNHPSTAAAAAASSTSYGSVVDALGPLPSIHARRGVIVDSNGATFSADDAAARRMRKEQRRMRALREADAAQLSTLGAVVSDEKPNAAPGAADAAWTDVPAEFCCALNGSLMKQPVR